MKKIKVGSVWNYKHSGQVGFVCIAVSKDGKHVVNGIEVDMVNPVWEVDYLLKNYVLDERF